jgi:hypothetical protein
MSRPNLDDIRTSYQVQDDEMISYRPRVLGIPLADGRQMTKTEGELLDRLQRDHGLLGLSNFRDIAQDAFATGTQRFPNNPVPDNIPADKANAWQGNDGHRDAFRHAYWSARLSQEYGADWARAFTTAHEGVPGNFANREAMDLYNNSIGIRIGAANPNASQEQLANLIQQAVTKGETVVMDRNGSLQWSDRVAIGQHGVSPTDVIGPRINTPGVVSTESTASLDRTNDPLYQQVQHAMHARGFEGQALAENLYTTAKNSGMAAVTDIRPGSPITGANGEPDRNLFVFDGKTTPLGANYAVVSENEARNGAIKPQEASPNVAVSPETPSVAETQSKRGITLA